MTKFGLVSPLLDFIFRGRGNEGFENDIFSCTLVKVDVQRMLFGRKK
jgi:hypothetical protein